MKHVAIVFLAFWAMLSTQTAVAQGGPNDLFEPMLQGAVRSYTESTKEAGKVKRVYTVRYSKAGPRSWQASELHQEDAVTTDSICWVPRQDSVLAFHCRSNKSSNFYMLLDTNGLVRELVMQYPNERVTYVAGYNADRQLVSLDIGRVRGKVFQPLSSTTYTYENGRIVASSNSGQKEQGVTRFEYDKKGRLVRSIREFRSGLRFIIEYGKHDKQGNWRIAKYENGTTMERTYTYY